MIRFTFFGINNNPTFFIKKKKVAKIITQPRRTLFLISTFVLLIMQGLLEDESVDQDIFLSSWEVLKFSYFFLHIFPLYLTAYMKLISGLIVGCIIHALGIIILLL